MRISTNQLFTQGINAMLDNQSRVARSQEQISTGLRMLQPSDDPVGAVRSVQLERAVERSEQFQRNAVQADSRLRLEESVISSTVTTLQRVHELAVQANNASQSNETRDIIAAEVREHLDSLLQYANSRDSNNRFLFAGFQEDVQPFSQSGGSFDYNGDDGQRELQIGPSRFLPTGDPGSAVFMSVREGNGSFATSASAANTGTGIIDGGNVVDPSAYDGDTYTISFTAPDTYEVLDSSATVVATGSYQSGDEISFQGVVVTITGEPATGDEFTVAPSAQSSIFAFVDALATSLETERSSPATRAAQTNEINSALANLDQSINHLVEVQTRVGSRLRALDQQTEINAGATLQFQETLSDIQNIDLAEAVSRFNQQLVSLQAAQQAFSQVQRLSLFNFI